MEEGGKIGCKWTVYCHILIVRAFLKPFFNVKVLNANFEGLGAFLYEILKVYVRILMVKVFLKFF